MSFVNKRPGGRILPVRRLTPHIDPQKQFEKLATAIGEIYKHNASQLSFEELYRIGYNLVLNKNGPLVYDGVKGVLEAHLLDCVHNDILKYAEIASAMPTIPNNEDLLSNVRMLWSEHVTAMLMIKDVLMYVDKVYVKNAHLSPVYEMGMNVFRDKVLLASNNRINTGITRAIMRQIEYERRGDEINRNTLRSVIDMLIELQDTAQLRPIYETVLEPQIFLETTSFYRSVASTRMAKVGAPEYVRAAQSDIDAEMDRADAYMAAHTSTPLRDILLDELITKHDISILTIPNDGLVQMFDQRNMLDLAILYGLFSPLPSAMKALQNETRDHIIALGKQMAASLAIQTDERPQTGSEGSSSAQEQLGAAARTAMALRWIQELISIYDVYDEFVTKSFSGSSDMRNPLNDGFITIVNENPRAPELLSLYIDDNLKNGLKGKSEQDMEHTFERAILLFRFLKDKDAFEHYYKVHLAKRLLFGRCLSDDAEQSLVSKLKVECGSQFTLKLEGMFKDMQMSADMESSFKEIASTNGLGFDMHVSVLTPTFWPALATATPENPGANKDSQVSAEQDGLIGNATDMFSDFYTKHRSGRMLTWQYSMGNADLKVRFGSRIHELNVTTYQMLVLILFANDDDDIELTTTQIQTKAHIPDEILPRLLQSLACAKYKVLAKTPMSRNISPTDKFKLNTNFKSPQYRLRIPMVSARSNIETDKEKAETMATITQERQYVIEAVVVRIMKARKQMVHEQLVNETINQLSSRFMPTSQTIKEAIERLIDREYLQRSPDNPRLYSYLA
ncbi:hypothetical protein GGI25_003456 [Coemansia spiralis]|uniref:Cullin family profile domain-containing protein n=2 Tax=Coemansia TaxID=4863 RepID=A0A9W8KY03_9FUNG|nr:hypothetical protein EDC05_003395 [Coemansia umbellata]KAJ2621575.1 hypothetical protein GGI26_004038 [Coemansia sp. RSA 1358]KAJ2676704.1 hypothetical protein GGI25_003456 [Coemansia spiralis]